MYLLHFDFECAVQLCPIQFCINLFINFRKKTLTLTTGTPAPVIADEMNELKQVTKVKT